MVINFCGFRRRARPNGSSEKAPETKHNGVLNKLMKPRSLLDAMKVKKRVEKKQELQLCIDKCKVMTLEDLIVSSPASNPPYDCMNASGGETSMRKQSSKKIHPSFDGDLNQQPTSVVNEASTTNQPQNGKVEAGISRTKPKKKVSFRSPEVADVFVLHYSPPPEINM